MKSLRRTGRLDSGARLGQEVVRTLKRRGVGQDGKAGSAAFGIGAGQSGRVEIRADQALRGAGFFNLCDQSIALTAGRQQALGETAHRRRGPRRGLYVRGWALSLAGGNFFKLIGFDIVKYGAHVV